MRFLARAALILFVVSAVVRLLLFLTYAAMSIPVTLLDAYHLESKMVHLAWRVQQGERLYPEWRSYPHVSNFFTPVYFLLVGGIGRLLGSSLDGLYLVGRVVTFSAVLGTTGLLAHDAAKRYGTGPAIVAALASLGVAPLMGYGVMTRPDTLADFLGLAGFLVCVRTRTRWSLLAGSLLLILAVMTKQTAGIYLVPAVIALAMSGRARDAGLIAAIVLASLILIVAGVTLSVEPNFAPSLLAEGRTPWSLQDWMKTSKRLLLSEVEWFVLALGGLWLWSREGTRDLPMKVFAIVMIPFVFLTIAKRGGDINYALCLRSIGSLGAAVLWKVVWSERPLSIAREVLLAGLALGSLSIGVSVFHALGHWANKLGSWQFMSSRDGEVVSRLFLRIHRLMADPKTPVLTDSSHFDVQQRERTAFGDPWLFHLQGELGELDLSTMRRWIEEERYEWVITLKDLSEPEAYAAYDFGLPEPLPTAIREHYHRTGSAAGCFFYRPNRLPDLPGAEGP